MASTTIPLRPAPGWTQLPNGGLVSNGPTDTLTALIVNLSLTPGTPISTVEVAVAAPPGGRMTVLVTEVTVPPLPSPSILAQVETDSAETLTLPVGRRASRVGRISVHVQTNAAGAQVRDLRAVVGSAVRGV